MMKAPTTNTFHLQPVVLYLEEWKAALLGLLVGLVMGLAIGFTVWHSIPPVKESGESFKFEIPPVTPEPQHYGIPGPKEYHL